MAEDYSVGFGGKFGVQRDRQDKSALGWDHQEEVQPHASQTGRAMLPEVGAQFPWSTHRPRASASYLTEIQLLKTECVQHVVELLGHCEPPNHKSKLCQSRCVLGSVGDIECKSLNQASQTIVCFLCEVHF